jgi:hypothetical protein
VAVLHHVLPGLRGHQGPILTVANWSGQWPGLVGLLNLNGSLVKTGQTFSSLWSETFDDPWFLGKLQEWVATGTVDHKIDHVRSLNTAKLTEQARQKGVTLAETLLQQKVILASVRRGRGWLTSSLAFFYYPETAGVALEEMQH